VNRHEKELPQLLRPLAQEPLEFRLEQFAHIVSELPALIQQHWDELGLYKDQANLEPDWDRYFDNARRGILHCFTARYEGVLVGYIAMLVDKHSQHGKLWADAHMFWLDKAFRTGWNGIKFFRFMEQVLKEEGVQFINIEHTIHFDLSNMFKYLGYKPKFITHTKYVGT
jgi:hypothetical protein